MMAFLQRGLEIRFRDERPGHEQAVTYKYSGGIEDFARHLNESKEPLFRKVAYYKQAEETQEVEVALQWNAGYYESLYSFANGIATLEGGMHEEGFKKALTNSLNRVARARNILKESDPNLQGEDIREGLTAIISVRLTDPQFEGQTKAKLGNVSIRSLVERVTNEKLVKWLEDNQPEASLIVRKHLRLSERVTPRVPRATSRAASLPWRGPDFRVSLSTVLTRCNGIRAVHRRG